MTSSKHLVDGKYTIKDLVDIKKLQRIFQHFTDTMGFTIGFLSVPDMEILAATGWRDICTKFHRRCPKSAENCRKSNARLVRQMTKPGKIVIELCANGLVDCAMPIFIKGKCVAILATGQVLLEAPDLSRFRRQAKVFGCNEKKYMAALGEVPVISAKRLKEVTGFLKEMAALVAELGYAHLKEKEKSKQLALDIFAKKVAEEKLRGSEGLFRAIAERGNVRIGMTQGRKIIYVNKCFAEMLGYEVDELVGRNFDSFVLPVDRPRMLAISKKRLRGFPDPERYEVKAVRKDGRVIEVEVHSGATVDIVGVPTVIAVFRDITESKLAAQVLKNEHALTNAVFDALPGTAYLFDEDGKFIRWNKNYEKIFGWTDEDMAKISALDTVAPYDRKRMLQTMHQMMKTGKSASMVLDTLTKDGRPVPQLCTAVIADFYGKPCVVGMAHDVSDRIKAEEALIESEARFRRIVEQAPIAMAVVNSGGMIEFINGKAVEVFGYQSADIPTMAKWWAQAYPDKAYRRESIADWTGRVKRALAKGVEIEGAEYRVTCKDRTVKTVFISGAPISGKVFVLFEDITDRKRFDDLLRQREAYLTSIIDNQSGMVWLKDKEGRFLAVNQVFAKMAGAKKPADVVGKTDLDYWPPKFAEGYRADDRKVMRSRKHVTVEELISKKGVARWHETFKTPVFDKDGIVIGTTGYARDITDRKQAEDALRESEGKFRAMFETSVSGMALCEMDGTLVQVNQAYLDMIGYTRKEALKLTYWDLTPKDYAKDEEKQLRSMERSGSYGPYEKEYIHKTRRRIPVLLNGAIVVGADGKKRIWSVVMDISERKKVEKALRESEEVFALFMRHSPFFTFIKEVTPKESRVLKASENFHKMIGIKGKNIIGKTMGELFPKDLAAKITADDWTAVSSGKVLRLEENFNGRNYLTIKFPITQGDRVLLGGYTIDITERKKAEEALKENERSLRESQSIAGVGSYVLDLSSGNWTSSPILDKLFGIDARYPRSVAGWEDLVHPDWRAEMRDYFDKEVVEKKGRFDKEYKILRHRDGKERWVHGLGKLELDANGKPVKMIGTIMDITARKEMEQALEKRISMLTQPAGAGDGVEFEDLFITEEIQQIQDEFTRATGVGSIITRVDGTPITRPSNFCSLCQDIIRANEKGRANCYKSDACIGRMNMAGPIVQPCLSGGLWDAGASITVGGRHVANWLIGQVRDETQSEDKIRAYAREIGADEDKAAEAFLKVPSMPRAQFDKVAQLLFTMARQLSQLAYQNLQQARAITESRRAEAVIRESRHQLFQVIDTVPHMIFAKDAEGKILLANRAVAAMYGKEAKELIGVRRRDIHPVPSEVEAYLKIDREVIQTGKPKIVADEIFTDVHGRKHVMQTIKVPFHMVGVKETCILGVSVDVTEQKKVEEFRNEIVRTVSHELRTPLSIEKEGISLLVDEVVGPVNPEQREILQTVMRSIDRLARMIASLLDISSIETGKIKLLPQPMDLADLVKDVIFEFEKRAAEKGIVLKAKLSGSPVRVLADPDKITQVLTNLVDNALKFTAKGSVEISLIPLKKEVECTVRDTGIGITPENVKKLFEKFQQFSRIAGPGEKGFGLGLSIAKGIVELHKGRIWAHSELGQGTSVTFALPLAKKRGIEHE